MDMQKLILTGRATRDAELIEPKSGNQFAVFSLAANRAIAQKDSKAKGEKKEEKSEGTTFYEILCFGPERAKIIEDKIKKGDTVLIEGRPEADAYLSKEGEPKAVLKVVLENWRVLKRASGK